MQKTKNMPLSPHLTIYKPQVTSMMSIFHRITGVVLYFGFLYVIWSIFLFVYDIKILNYINKFLLDNIFGNFLIFSWLFALFFHTFSGVRYLFWGFSIGINMRDVTVTSYIIIFFAFIFTIFSMKYIGLLSFLNMHL